MSNNLVSDSRVVPAPPEEFFALLADPARHNEIDGSETVQKLLSEPGFPEAILKTTPTDL